MVKFLKEKTAYEIFNYVFPKDSRMRQGTMPSSISYVQWNLQRKNHLYSLAVIVCSIKHTVLTTMHSKDDMPFTYT